MNSINRRLERLRVRAGWEDRSQAERERIADFKAKEAEFRLRHPPPIQNLEWPPNFRIPPIAFDGYLYFVECQEFIKIGWTLQLEKRLSAIGVAVPFSLRLLYATAGSRADESQLHLRFGKHQHKGEWYRNVPEILDYIEELKAADDER